MNKPIVSLLTFGLKLGIRTSAVSMLIGIMCYYLRDAIDVCVSLSYLKYAAITAFFCGLLVMFSWYIYVLWCAHQFFKKTILKDRKDV